MCLMGRVAFIRLIHAMIYKFGSWKPMTADTQSQIDAIFN